MIGVCYITVLLMQHIGVVVELTFGNLAVLTLKIATVPNNRELYASVRISLAPGKNELSMLLSHHCFRRFEIGI